MAGLESTEKQLQRIETEVEGLVNKLTRLNDVTEKSVNFVNEFGMAGSKSVSSFSNDISKAEALMLKIQDMRFSGNIDASSISKLVSEYEALNNSALQMKINEAAAADELKSYIEYAGQLKSYLNGVIKLLGQATSESKHLGEYMELNSESIKPYGINTRKATDDDKKLLDNAERVTVGGSVFEINTEQLRQIGPEYEAAVREFISFLTQFKSLNRELSATGGVNNISARRFLSNTGEIRPEYQGVLAIGNNNDLNDEREYTKGVDVAKVSYKEDGKLVERIVKQIAVTPGLKGEDGLNLGLYAQSNSNRLEGFKDEQGEHLGYKQLVSGLENVIEKVIASLGKLANFAPGLMSENTKSGFNPILSEGVGYSSTDIAKRMSYGDIIEGDNETGVENVKDVGITLVKSFDELGQSSSEVKGKLENLGSVLPGTTSDVRKSSDGLDYLANRRIGDKDITDSYGNTTSSIEYLDANADYEAVKFSADIRENMTESQKKAAEMVADLKNGISKEITKSGMMTSLVNDDEQRTLQQYSFSSNYRGSKKDKGAVDYWGQAKSEIEKLDARISNNSVDSTDITRQLALVMDTFKKGGVEALAKPESEFSDKTSLQILNDMLADLMKEVNAFDKGSYAESASKPDKDGKVLFDKQKYIDFVTNINTKLQSILNDDKFKDYGNDTKQLDEINTRAEEVQKVVQNTRNAETNKKLDSEYIKNMMQEHFLSKEIAGREANISSGLLAGSDLENAIKRVEQLNNDLQSTRDNITQIVSEGESLGKSFDTTNERANTLKSLYDDIARSLGSTAEADKFFSQVKGLSSLNYDSLTGVVSSFGDKLSNVSIDTLLEQLKVVKNDLGLMSGGTYERALSSSIISSKGLSKSEQEVAAYQNNATREQLYNARVAMTDSFNVPEDFKENIKVDELNQGIDKVKQSFINTAAKIEEMAANDTTGALAGKIIDFKDKLGRLEVEFNKLTQGIDSNSALGELRAVFENSKALAISLNTLQSKVNLAANSVEKPLKSDVTSDLVKDITDKKRNTVKFNIADDEQASKLLSEIINKAKLTHTAFNNMSKQSATDEISEDFKVLASRVGEILYEAPMLYQELNGIGESRDGIDLVYKHIAKLASRMQQTIDMSHELNSSFKDITVASSLIKDTGIRNSESNLKALYEEALSYKENQKLLTGSTPSPESVIAKYDDTLKYFKPESDEYKILESKKLVEQEAIRKGLLAEINGLIKDYELGLTNIASKEELLNKVKEKAAKLSTDTVEGKKALEVQLGLEEDIKKAKEKALADSNKEEQDALTKSFNAYKTYVERRNAVFKTLGKAPMTAQEELDYYTKNFNKFKGTKYFADAAIIQQKAEEKVTKELEAELNKRLEAVKNYVAEENALRIHSGQAPMTHREEAAYYASQLPKFADGPREYIEVLKLKNQAEAKAADEAQKAADKEKQAYEESLNAAKQKITQGLSAIKSFADGVNNAVNKVINIIRTGIRLVNKVISTAGRILTTLGNGVKSIVSLFGGLSNRVRSTGSDFNFFKNSATELRSKIMLLKGALSTLFNNSMVNQAKKMMSSVLSMSVIIKNDLTNSTIEWAKSLEQAFGVDAKGLIADMGEISGVLHGLGMKAQDVADGGANLVMMSRYLGMMGMAGGDADQVMTKLTSGMKGMTQAIDDLGLSVREAEMDSYLENLKKQGGEFANIGTSFASLNEEARVYVRYTSLITQFLENFGKFDTSGNYIFDVESFRRSLNSVTGRLGLLKSTWSGFTTTVGTGLAKIGALLAGYLIPIIKVMTAAVEKVFGWLSKLTGINFDVGLNADVNSLDYDTSGTEKATEDTEELNKELEKVEEKAKKAKGSLQGFDRVNNVTSSSSNSDSASGDDEFDYSKLATGIGKLLDPLNTEYEDFLANIDKKNKEYSDKLKKGFYNLVEYLKKKAAELTGRTDFNLGFDWTKIKQSLVHIKDNILSLIKTWGTFFIEIGLKIADDINIGAIITSVLGLIDAVTGLAAAFSKWLAPVLSNLYDKYLSPLVSSLGQAIVNKLDEWANKIKYITALIKILTGQPLTLDELILTNESETFNEDLENMRTKLEGLQAKLDNIFKKIADGIRYLTGQMSLDEVIAINEDESGWATFLKTLDAVKYIISEIAKGLAEWAKTEALPWLIEKLKEIGKFVSEHREKIVELIEKIAGIAWDGFKTFVDLVGKLIGFVVKNPDSVYGFFAGLLGLKVASWFADVATSIGLAVVGMEGFTKALGSGGILSKLGTLLGVTAAPTAATSLASAVPMVTQGATTMGAMSMTTTGALTSEALTAMGTANGLAATGGATAGAGGAAAAGGVALGPILAVIAAVVALIAVVKDLWDTSEGFRESVSNAWEYIKNAFDSAKEAIAPAIESLKEAWSTFYESYESSGLKEILGTILSFVVEVLGGTLSIAISAIGQAVALIVNLLGDIIVVISGVIDAVSGFIKIIIGIFTLDGDMIKEGWGELVTGLVEIVSGLIQAIVDIIGNVGGLILDIGKNIFGGLFEGMSEAWNTGVENVKDWFNSWIDSIKEFFGIHSPSTLFAEFGGYIVQGLINGISDMWQTLVTGVTNLCNTFVNSVKNILMSVVSVGSTLVNGIWSGISSAWSTLSSGVSRLCSDLISSIKNAIGNGWNSITGWLDSVGSKISDGWNAITGKTSASKAKTVTSHAVGGSIAGGQLFVANENGQPELIGDIDGSPKTNVANNNMIIEAMTDGVFTGVYNALAEVNNQRGTVGGAGQNVNLKIDGFGLIDSSTLSELARMLAPYLSSNSKNIADINFSI